MGEARHRAYLEDHAALGLGLLALYQTDFNPRWYTAARQRADEILAAFSDPAGGFYDTRHDHEPLLARPRSLQDSPVPSGSTMAAILLLQLAALTGESLYDQAARRPMEGMQAAAAHHPSAFAGWLCAIDFGLEPPLQLAVVGPREHQGFESLLQVANSRFRPGLVMAAGAGGVSEPPLLRDRKSLGGVPTAYLCRQFTCDLPTTSAKELADQISQSVVPSTKA